VIEKEGWGWGGGGVSNGVEIERVFRVEYQRRRMGYGGGLLAARK
jgi:hypothetical protein